MSRDITFDGNALSSVGTGDFYVQDINRGLLGLVRDKQIAIPGRDGDYPFSERRGNRVITAVVAQPKGPAVDTDRSEMSALAAWLEAKWTCYLKL